MAMVDLNEDIYKEVTEVVGEGTLEYPTIKNFVNKAVKAFIDKEKKKGGD